MVEDESVDVEMIDEGNSQSEISPETSQQTEESSVNIKEELDTCKAQEIQTYEIDSESNQSVQVVEEPSQPIPEEPVESIPIQDNSKVEENLNDLKKKLASIDLDQKEESKTIEMELVSFVVKEEERIQEPEMPQVKIETIESIQEENFDLKREELIDKPTTSKIEISEEKVMEQDQISVKTEQEQPSSSTNVSYESIKQEVNSQEQLIDLEVLEQLHGKSKRDIEEKSQDSSKGDSNDDSNSFDIKQEEISPEDSSGSVRRSRRLKSMFESRTIPDYSALVSKSVPQTPTESPTNSQYSSPAQRKASVDLQEFAPNFILTPEGVTQYQGLSSAVQPIISANDRLVTDRELIDERLSKFITITENIYLSQRVVCKINKTMKCDCTISEEEIRNGDLGCRTNCINRLLYIECSTKCRLGKCFHCSF